MSRQKRDQRRRGVQVKLGTRDEAILRALARLRLVGTAELGSLLFSGVSRNFVNQRLRRLYDAGYLDVSVRDRTTPNLYSLGPHGRQWAHDHGLKVISPPRSGREHYLAIVRCWATLAAAIHGLPDWRLQRFLPECEIREMLKDQWQAVIPDAGVEMSFHDAPQLVRAAIEVDLGTERLPVLTKKIKEYQRLLVGGEGVLGWEDFGLIVVTQSWTKVRRDGLARLMSETWSGWWISWEIGLTVERLQEVLRRLPNTVTTTPHYGSENEDAVSPEFIETSSVTRQGLCHENDRN